MNGNQDNTNYNKYNLDPKWVKCAGCSKSAELRHEKGKFIISAYRGLNNEELCHKCAYCYHCGKKEKWDIYRKRGNEWEVEKDYGMPSYHKIDKDNPSGGWEIAFCLDCHHNKGFEIFRYYDDREYWEVDGVMFNPRTKREWNNFENWEKAHQKAQEYWNSLSSSEREKECERIVEKLKLRKSICGRSWAGNKDMEGYGSGWACDGSFWQIKNGKFVSSQPHLVPCEIAEEFVRKMFGDIDLSKELVLRDCKITINKDQKDNSVPPNPAAQNSQPITNSDSKNNNSASPNNSSESNPGKDESAERKSEVKTIKFEKTPPKSTENSPNKEDNQTLIIDLRSIKKITLTADGNLVIEFNKSENNSNNSQGTQVINKEQINSDQELQKVKNYLEKSKQKCVNQQELNSILNANSTTSEKPKDSNNSLLIVGIGGVLVIGVIIGLVLTKKRNIKKN